MASVSVDLGNEYRSCVDGVGMSMVPLDLLCVMH